MEPANSGVRSPYNASPAISVPWPGREPPSSAHSLAERSHVLFIRQLGKVIDLM